MLQRITIDEARKRARAMQNETPSLEAEIADWVFAHCLRALNQGREKINYRAALKKAQARAEITYLIGLENARGLLVL